MKVTLEYVERKFAEFNDLMFEGKLKPLPFRLSRARTFLGMVRYKRKRKLFGGWHYSDFQFVISSLYDMPENEVEDTIIHEMIHYWIFSNQMQDNKPHGNLFCGKMEEINRRFGRHLTVTHTKTEADLSNDREIRRHLICISKIKDSDALGITIASKTKLFMLWDELPKVRQVSECAWYVSTDPFFNRFPRASSLKIYKISKEDLDAHRHDFKPLVRMGDTIMVGRQ